MRAVLRFISKRYIRLMDQIKVEIQGIRVINRDGTHQLVLMALNNLWADILLHSLGSSVRLKYEYDGSDTTFYLVFELPDINKLFKAPVNSTTETRKWLSLIDNKKINAIRVGYRDGKGGLLLYGGPVAVSW